jgi:membrane fusion protein (multidrug efflux system)
MIPDIVAKLKKDKRFRAAAAIVIAAAILAAGWGISRSFSRESTDDAFIDGHVVAISPKVSGHVAKVHITDNQAVEEGDALFDIDDRDYVVRCDLARADLKAAQVEVEQAQTDFERYQKLRATGDISDQRYDEAAFRLQTAQAKSDAAQARLKQAELDLSYTKVTAPVTGRIAQKNVEPGSFVQVGQALVAIVAPQRWVTANFKETQLTHMRPGQKATIKIDAYPSMVLSGHVDSIQQGTGSRFSLLPAENATGNFIKVVQRVPVKIVFDTRPKDLEDVPLGLSVIPTVTVR